VSVCDHERERDIQTNRQTAAREKFFLHALARVIIGMCVCVHVNSIEIDRQKDEETEIEKGWERETDRD
jgi:hypothetical protein